MNVARVIDGTVVNLEVVTPEWLKENKDAYAGVTFVEFPDDLIVLVGTGWSEETGFEQSEVAGAIHVTDPLTEHEVLAHPGTFDPIELEIEAALAGE